MTRSSQHELSALAATAGLAEHWTGADNRPRQVSPDTLRALLRGMDLCADSAEDIRDSRQRLMPASGLGRLPAMLVATAGESVDLPASCAGHYEILTSDGKRAAGHTTAGADGAAQLRAPDTPGYYTLSTRSGTASLAVAPRRAPTLDDLVQTPNTRIWGLTAQVHSLRRSSGDLRHATHGFGDLAAVRELAEAAAAAGADALAISPIHALFAADPGQCSPYSPSSRLFMNTLYADPATVLGEDAMRQALGGLDNEQLRALDAQPLIDWPASGALRQRLLRGLHAWFTAHATSEQRQHYRAYCATAGQDLQDHALFEALHLAQTRQRGMPAPWTEWPGALRDPQSAGAVRYAQEHPEELDAHMFNQWLASASLSQAHRAARNAGMRIGLIADLAIGGSAFGSHAWSRQADLVKSAGVGAPPDLHNPQGQCWNLTALSPATLLSSGFSAFLAMLRANLSNVGGLRIDHVLGMARLWLIPDGAAPEDGAYLSYPLRSLLKLTALEAWLHRALIVGENLGTVPEGFDPQLFEHGLLGMDVLWFMRKAVGAAATETNTTAAFVAPSDWPPQAVAMTTTHDLPTLTGWWHAQDIAWRSRLSLLGADEDESLLRRARNADRSALWQAVQAQSRAMSHRIMPRQAPIPELLGFVAAAPCPLMLVPLEDVTGQLDQPNLPGTMHSHPNWRQRLSLPATQCVDAPDSMARLQPVRSQRGKP
ncbi:4-alpha-glucanotransferase [Achromobacter pestifer]